MPWRENEHEVKQKGQREPPMRPKMQPSWVSEKIRLSFKKNPIGLQIPPPPKHRITRPARWQAGHQAPDAERKATAPDAERKANTRESLTRESLTTNKNTNGFFKRTRNTRNERKSLRAVDFLPQISQIFTDLFS